MCVCVSSDSCRHRDDSLMPLIKTITNVASRVFRGQHVTHEYPDTINDDWEREKNSEKERINVY